MTFFAIALTIWSVVHAYLGWRLLGPAGRGGRIAWALVLAVIVVLPPVTVVLDRTQADVPMKDALRWTGFASMGFSLLLASVFAAGDLVRVAAWIGRRAARRPAPPVDPGRRLFLRRSLNLGAVAATGTVTAVGAADAQSVPRVEEVAIPIAGLHPDLAGFRIAQITDLHVGPTIRGDYAAAVARVVNGLAPDLIAVTGDLVDGHVAERGPDVAPLRALAAPHGVFFVTGNHEYYWDVHAWLAELRGHGWTVLLDEHRVVRRGAATLLVAGVTDRSARRHEPAHVSDPAAARAGAPACDASILLAHRPKSVFEAAKVRYDLQLSGHTHGGQFFPASLFVHLFEPYVRGLHRRDDTWLYVGRGTGYWGPPLRAGVPAEITLLRLERA